MDLNIVTITKAPPRLTQWASVEFTHAVMLYDVTVSPPWRAIALCRSLDRAKSLREHDPYMFEDELRILDLETGELCDEEVAA